MTVSIIFGVLRQSLRCSLMFHRYTQPRSASLAYIHIYTLYTFMLAHCFVCCARVSIGFSSLLALTTILTRLGLSAVAEESPAKSGQPAKNVNQTVPESPETREETSKLSGTTFLNLESGSEVESDDEELDALSIVDELPDLQRAAAGFLNVLISGSSDPSSIANAARRMKDPKSTERRRLKLHAKKLVDRMKHFSSQTFIDVERIHQLVSLVSLRDIDQSWSPTPILHSANCARLALEIILATPGSDSAKQTIRSLETQFPVAFLDHMDNGSRPISVGVSATKKATFDLALEIRTQFFIMELERRASEEGFNPTSILRGVFYDDLAVDSGELDPSLLRGFRLAGIFEEENGHLPDRYQEAVTDRIAELEFGLLDEDGFTNVEALSAAFPWSRFLLRTARFVHSREKEIKRDLRTQPDIDDVQSLIVRQIKLRDETSSLATPEQRAPSISRSSAHLSQPSPALEDRGAGERRHGSGALEPLRELGISIPGPSGTAPSLVGKGSPQSQKVASGSQGPKPPKKYVRS